MFRLISGTHCKFFYCITNILSLVLEHLLNWCVPYGEWACIDNVMDLKIKEMCYGLIHKPRYLRSIHYRNQYHNKAWYYNI